MKTQPETTAAAILLCAGKGTRMNDGSRNKVCFDCAGVPVIRRIIDNMRAGGVGRFVVVVGYRAESVMACLDGIPGVVYAYQREQKGTGHAALCGLNVLRDIGYAGPVIISMGDKIIAPGVVAGLVARAGSAQAVWGVQPVAANPGGGRVVTDNGKPFGVVELADAALLAVSPLSPESRAEALRGLGLNEKKAAKVLAAAGTGGVRSSATLCGRDFTAAEILATRYANAGLYCFDTDAIFEALGQIGSDNAQGEIYLTDALAHFSAKGRAELFEVRNADDMLTYSTRPELRRMSRFFLRSASELLAAVESGAMRETFATLYGEDGVAAAESRYARLLRGFVENYGDRKAVIARAPGRVNLMGRHIDHRGGGVNVMAMDRDTVVVAAPRDDDTVSVANLNPAYPFGSFSIGAEMAASSAPKADTTASWLEYLAAPQVVAMLGRTRGNWANYVKSAVLRFQFAYDLPLSGMDIFADGNIPPAAGLSSSSSIVVAVAEAVVALNGLNIAPRRFVDLCGEGEWFVGSRGGSGDHAAMKCSARGRITHLGFKPFEIGASAPFDDKYAVLVVDSLEKAKKSEGGKDRFNACVASYEFAFMLVRKYFPDRDLREFRDLAAIRPHADIYRILRRLPEKATRDELRALLPDSGARLDEIFATHADPGAYALRGVALFGISECARSARFMEALEAGDYGLVGAMMKRSHDGDRAAGLSVTDAFLNERAAQNADVALECGAYGCSTPRIDALCDLLDATPGVVGSEIVGAGLGGSVIAIVEKARAEEVLEVVSRGYYGPLDAEPKAFVCEPGVGSAVMY